MRFLQKKKMKRSMTRWSFLFMLSLIFFSCLDQFQVKAATALNLYYDDRVTLSELQASGIPQISNEVVTSKKVGTSTPDDHVLIYENDRLIAVGTGTANVQIGDKSFNVTVSRAPISMILLAGHSFCEGLMGDASESILCDDGWAYDTRIKLKPSSLQREEQWTAEDVSTMGIGYGSSKRLPNIDALTSAGSGERGNDSALAAKWKELTHEKLWVINTGIGGTDLSGWSPIAGGNGLCYGYARSIFGDAEIIMTNEIAAGHYDLKHMGVVYHGCENGDQTWEIKRYTSYFEAMWEGLKKDFAHDFGSGVKTFDCLAVMPVWRAYSGRLFNSDPLYENPYVFNNAKEVVYQKAYFENDGVILGTDIPRQWLTDAAVSEFFAKRPVDSFYSKTHKNTLPSNPTQMKWGVFGDGVHHNQLGYNITGLDVMENMYHYWTTPKQAKSLRLLLEDGITEVEGSSASPYQLESGQSLVVIPDTEGGVKLTAQTRGSIVYEAPCRVRATGSGTGTLTMKSAAGTVLKTVVFQVGGESSGESGGGSSGESGGSSSGGSSGESGGSSSGESGGSSSGEPVEPGHVCGNATHVEAKSATCEEAGVRPYYACSCGRNYMNKACTGEITMDITLWSTVQPLGHDLADATCEKPRTCQRTGCTHTEGSKLGHDLTAASCTETAHCKRTGCNYVSDAALGHDLAAATCEKPKTCKRTGCTYTEGSKLGHDLAAATCEKPKTCKRTGCTYTEGSKLGHDLAAATCEKPKTCKRTGCTYTEGSKLGHDFSGGYEGSNSTTHWHICKRTGCDATDTPVAHGGGIMNPTVNPTCTTDGSKINYLCPCGRRFLDGSYTQELSLVTFDAWVVMPALGHDFSGDFDGHNETSKWHICKRPDCDAIDTPVALTGDESWLSGGNDNPGGNIGEGGNDNPGGNTGEGDNDNPGGNTGEGGNDNPGGNTGEGGNDNPGGNTGEGGNDNPGVNTGDVSGGQMDVNPGENGTSVSGNDVTGPVVGNASISDCGIEMVKKNIYYTGKALKPQITVQNGEMTLVEGVDYTLTYSNNKKVGMGCITVTGQGKYTGVTEYKFEIRPKKITSKKPSTKKNQITVKWKANKKQGAGYKIQYSTKKNFKGKKTVTVKSAKTSSKVIKKLKSGKTYYIRICAYKKVGKKTLMGPWSKTQKIKVR